jgi:hypothetical protein
MASTIETIEPIRLGEPEPGRLPPGPRMHPLV